MQSYGCAVEQFQKWAGVPLSDVTPAMADAWATHLITDRGLAPATVNVKLAAMTSLYDYARSRYGAQGGVWSADRANPFDIVDRMKVSPYGRAIYPTTEELRAILAQIDRSTVVGKRDYALFFGFAITLRRSAEWLGLRWGDIQHSGEPGENRIYSYNVMKKGAGRRDQAVLAWHIYSAILDYLRAAGRLDGVEHDTYIWTPLYPGRSLRLKPDLDLDRVANSPISNRTANNSLKRYAKKAGVDLKKAHLHGLRHAGSRLRVEQMKEKGNVDYLELCKLLNHSTIAVTQVYVDEALEDPEDPGAKDAVNALLPA